MGFEYHIWSVNKWKHGCRNENRENDSVDDSWKDKISFVNSWILKNVFVNSWISIILWFVIREYEQNHVHKIANPAIPSSFVNSWKPKIRTISKFAELDIFLIPPPLERLWVDLVTSFSLFRSWRCLVKRERVV